MFKKIKPIRFVFVYSLTKMSSQTSRLTALVFLVKQLKRSGIKPRDGSLIYALDNNGIPFDNHLPIGSVPNNLLLGPSDKISQVWGEKWANNLGEVNDFNKGCIVVPGLEIGEYSTIFIVSRKGKINYITATNFHNLVTIIQ